MMEVVEARINSELEESENKGRIRSEIHKAAKILAGFFISMGLVLVFYLIITTILGTSTPFDIFWKKSSSGWHINETTSSLYNVDQSINITEKAKASSSKYPTESHKPLVSQPLLKEVNRQGMLPNSESPRISSQTPSPTELTEFTNPLPPQRLYQSSSSRNSRPSYNDYNRFKNREYENVEGRSWRDRPQLYAYQRQSYDKERFMPSNYSPSSRRSEDVATWKEFEEYQRQQLESSNKGYYTLPPFDRYPYSESRRQYIRIAPYKRQPPPYRMTPRKVEYNPPPNRRQNYRDELRRPGHRAPAEFRYPSSAGSIQDIIDYMKSKEKRSYDHERRIRPLRLPPGHVIGSQDHVVGGNPHVKVRHNRNEGFHSAEYTDSRFQDDFEPDIEEENLSYRFSNDRSQEVFLDNERPSIHDYKNRFKKMHHKEDGYIRSSRPVSLILDVYPVRNVPRRDYYDTHSRILEEENRRIDNHRFSDQEDLEKQEIILHLNLYRRNPLNRRNGNYDDDRTQSAGISIEIPVDGPLTAEDVYLRILDDMKQRTPTALAQLSEESDGGPPDGIILGDLDFQLDKNQLLAAIREGLRKLNPFLPPSKRFIVQTVNMTGEASEKRPKTQSPPKEKTTPKREVSTIRSINSGGILPEPLPTPCWKTDSLETPDSI